MKTQWKQAWQWVRLGRLGDTSLDVSLDRESVASMAALWPPTTEELATRRVICRKAADSRRAESATIYSAQLEILRSIHAEIDRPEVVAERESEARVEWEARQASLGVRGKAMMGHHWTVRTVNGILEDSNFVTAGREAKLSQAIIRAGHTNLITESGWEPMAEQAGKLFGKGQDAGASGEARATRKKAQAKKCFAMTEAGIEVEYAVHLPKDGE